MKHRPFFLLALALAAPLMAQPGKCHATPVETRKDVPWSGSTGELRWTANPIDCAVEKNVAWIGIRVMPPVTGSDERVLSYTVDNNLTSAERTAKIQIGDAAVELVQRAGPRPGMAFSPNHLDFRYVATNDAPKEITKPIYVGSDEALLFSAKLAEPADWIKVQATNDPIPQRQQTFMITVKAASLSAGVHKAILQLDADGASNAHETIPIVVRVEPPPPVEGK